MKSRILLVITALISTIILGCFGLYFGLKAYYRNTFFPNTWINGIYCTGKSIDEINKELIQKTVLPKIIISSPDGQIVSVMPECIEMKVDYTGFIQQIKNKTGALCLKDFNKDNTYQIETGEYSWNETKLKEQLAVFPFVIAEQNKEYGCRVIYGEDGFSLYDGNHQRLNYESLPDYIEAELKQGRHSIVLCPESCYINIKDSETDVKQKELWNIISSFVADHTLTYDMGAEQILIDNRVISSFLWNDNKNIINFDEEEQLLIDKDKVYQWVDALADKYDTVGTTRSFQTTRGDSIEIAYVTYGTKLNTAAEKEFLLEQMLCDKVSAENRNHVPLYIKQGYTRGQDDLGNTYIEVDMTNQHMYYYQNGTLMLDTDIVTGNIARRMGTPEGINQIYRKQKNRVLIGPNYATPVKFWVPVKGNVGIHDANWRSEFGGEIYKTNGSHGCINTPTEKMAELYDMVEVGTPVVMFY